MALGKITKYMAVVSTDGRMAEATSESGHRTICKATATTSTLMESGTTAGTLTIKRKVTAFTTGQMVASTKAGGTRANSMALVSTLTPNETQESTECGSSARELNGSMTMM